LPPYTQDNLPTLGPFPETMTPTTTTLFPPPPPPGRCVKDGIYRGMGEYEEIGEGLCVDKGGMAIAFKKRRELTSLNVECLCKEACDLEPDCIGYSTNHNDEGNGLSCRVYGWDFPALQDRWANLDSNTSPRYSGKKIAEADGEKGMICFRKGKKVEAKKEEFVQIQRVETATALPPPSQISLVVRETSTSDRLVWQREQLARCREQEASLLSVLEQKGCRASGSSGLRRQGRGSSNNLAMPNECQCHCPDCNFWQLPPPICHEPTPEPIPTVPPLPSGVIVVTGPPRPQTPPPMPVQMPLPQLPPIGDQFLPTLGPWPPPPPVD